VASSPSVWWNRAHITQELERVPAASLPAARVRISIGEYEQTPSPRIDAQAPRARMMAARGQVRHARAFAKRLREHQPQVAMEFGEYPQATHATSALYGIVDGLRFISAK
jgi:predicted alpha/beta superfamily hydrolase